jgi:hypothetical protein
MPGHLAMEHSKQRTEHLGGGQLQAGFHQITPLFAEPGHVRGLERWAETRERA